MPTNFDAEEEGELEETGVVGSSSTTGLEGGKKSVTMTSKSQDPSLTLGDRLKILYPMVDERETKLPRCWSVKDKFNFIGLSQNNLRVQYKGNGKSHKEASSVRATDPIPASCGIYYFEVKIVSKGRDGYMGVGLSAQGVNMNRLPGWDKHSYGYHGDDGNSFCSSGTGQAYGPTFTTGDVIGCGLDLVDRSCFYTKNGHHLGVAFKDLPPFLYPTVGLQTPGEVIDANFGQEPFVFDVEGEMRESQARVRRVVENFPPPGKHGDWQQVLHKMVLSYLVHQGYCATTEAFAKSTSAGQDVQEDFSSIRNRQDIQKHVQAGRMGEAIATTDRLYPGFLQSNPSLHFSLKVRQFIEMVGGNDDDGGGGGGFEDGQMEVDDGRVAVVPNGGDGLSVLSNPVRFGKLIQFGRQLQTMLQDMEGNQKHVGTKAMERNRKMQQDAFALVAYPNPWESPVGWQLKASERESVSNSLNSAILELRFNRPARPPLEVSLAHAKDVVKLMAKNDLGACAFANVDDFIR